jgi:hypothetical protein
MAEGSGGQNPKPLPDDSDLIVVVQRYEEIEADYEAKSGPVPSEGSPWPDRHASFYVRRRRWLIVLAGILFVLAIVAAVLALS